MATRPTSAPTPQRVRKRAPWKQPPCSDAQRLAPGLAVLATRFHSHTQLIDQLIEIVDLLQQRISALEDRLAKIDPPPPPTADETFERLEREAREAAADSEGTA